jgi:hypothetical protein
MRIRIRDLVNPGSEMENSDRDPGKTSRIRNTDKKVYFFDIMIFCSFSDMGGMQD